MKSKLVLLILFAVLLAFNYVSEAQEKYAVLITGDYAAQGIPIEEQWNQGQGKSIYGMEEFWYDTYLMWEMLVFEKGFSDENVFVLFADGIDFTKPNMPDRYNAEVSHFDYYPITDYEASIEYVQDVFNGLAYGVGDFTQMTEDDFLFVWIFDHGGPVPPQSPVYFQLMDGNMTVLEFAILVNPVPANKKVFWMQQCRSGSFASELESQNTFFHSSCQPNERSAVADNFDIDGNQVTESDNYYGYGDHYRHGEFDFHLYGAMVGVSPAGVDHYSGQPYVEADENNDNYITVLESYNWEDTHESIDDPSLPGEDPLFSDEGSIGANTSLDYPTLLFSDIIGDDIIVSYRGLIGISKDIHITSGNQLVFNANADVKLLNESKLIIDEGASLLLESNVEFIGTHPNNQLVVNGEMEFGDNVHFFSEIGDPFEIIINNNNATLTINNVEFDHCELHNNRIGLNINSCNFNNSNLYSNLGDITIANSLFSGSYPNIVNQWEDFPFKVTITDCEFSNATMGLDIWNYDEFNISYNDFLNLYIGMQIIDCGEGKGDRNIYENNINNNSYSGITVYNSSASIFNNHINNNKYGVKFHNNSNIALYGNPGAQSLSETQTIKDNDSYEVYASQYSFPFYFRYNGIIDENNSGAPLDPLVYHNDNFSIKDVRYNCWGNNFSASEDLYGGGYIWSPTWCPPDNGEGADEDEQLFMSAQSLVEQENYTDAKNSFQLLIEQYPESKYANASMKELFGLEKYVNNDYIGIKQYYETNSTIQSDTSLNKLSGFLINKCNLKLENWVSAISWYENIIQNPENMEDSIFAIIDLGYAYILMENGGYKSAYTGSMIEHKPTSIERFVEKRDFLLSLIPGDQMSETLKGNIAKLEEGELLQNIPNPFSGSTQIWFKLENESNVQINIYNYTGQLIKSINEGTKTKGTHHIDFDASGLENGIFFYSISINGKITDSKKMTIMK